MSTQIFTPCAASPSTNAAASSPGSQTPIASSAWVEGRDQQAARRSSAAGVSRPVAIGVTTAAARKPAPETPTTRLSSPSPALVSVGSVKVLRHNRIEAIVIAA